MADDQVADDQVADGQAPDDLTQGVRVCVANLTKVTDELSDAVKVKDEERAKLTEKIESLEYAASVHARGMAELEEARFSITITMARSKRQAAEQGVQGGTRRQQAEGHGVGSAAGAPGKGRH